MAREFDFSQGVRVENTQTTGHHINPNEDLDRYLCEMEEWYAEREWGGLVCQSDSTDKTIWS